MKRILVLIWIMLMIILITSCNTPQKLFEIHNPEMYIQTEFGIDKVIGKLNLVDDCISYKTFDRKFKSTVDVLVCTKYKIIIIK